MGQIESMFEKMMKKKVDYDAHLVFYNTSICNLEVQLGQISQALNTRPNGALPSDTIVNLKGGNNTGHAMAVTTRSGRGGETSTSKQKEVVSDDVEAQNEDDPIVVEQVSEEKLDARAPLPRAPPPYPQRLENQKNENQFKKFIEMMKSLSINVPLVEALEQMLGYARFIKDLVTKNRSMDCETIKMTHQVSVVVHLMAPNLEDPDAFTIPRTIRSANFAKALCNLGASINLMPYSVFKTLGIGQPRDTSMRLKMEDRTMNRSLGIINDVIVRVDKFILLADFVILDCEVDYELPIILGRPFLAIGKALVDMEAGDLTFRDEGLVEYVNALHIMGSYSCEPRKLSLDLENRKTPPKKPLIEEPPVLELKTLPPHLRTILKILAKYATGPLTALKIPRSAKAFSRGRDWVEDGDLKSPKYDLSEVSTASAVAFLWSADLVPRPRPLFRSQR
uniref:Uncharacterized protein LOC104215798 n=1 Tax=Nicotiana sylvestris TaxID=4096 RepID=A0A1U7V790_NICSY|nr:PREDICTED: uncharacterized protein LOC104215798 [Nicotiana sylvestris]